jgi:hypothetical protein
MLALIKTVVKQEALRFKSPFSVIAVPAYRREPVGYAHAVVDRHPIFVVLFLLLLFLAHDLGELSRRILGEPPGPAIV